MTRRIRTELSLKIYHRGCESKKAQKYILLLIKDHQYVSLMIWIVRHAGKRAKTIKGLQ